MRTQHPFSLTRYMALLLFVLPVVSWTAFAQSGRKQITGTVLDSSGETVPGVTIMVKGHSNRGTATNTDGAFVISVAPSEILIFSCVSYKTREVPASYFTTSSSLTLEDDTESLKDAVVVGYGVQKKVSVVGAISTVNMAELKSTPTSNLSAALAGKVPGLVTNQISGEPGSDVAYLYVRGLSPWGA